MAKARVMVAALDAADPGLIEEMAAAGEMPAMARVIRDAARVNTLAPLGVFVGANWPTIFNAVRADRHHYVCWDEFRGGTYEYRETTPHEMEGTPLWERLSEAGRRVAIVDVPHTVPRRVNGVMVSEWGCHDRHLGTASWPAELAAELSARHGTHFGMCEPPGRDQFAPCDYTLRDGVHRTDDETVAIFETICDGIENKRRVALDLLDRGDWDLFWNVMGESHCIGHQMWHLHEREHPKYDAALAARLGGDPIREIYRRLDGVIGDQLERLEPGDTAYVLFAHGMRAHHDGTHLLDHILHRLDWGLDEPDGYGAATGAAAPASRFIPQPLRPGALRLAAPVVRRAAGDAAPGPLPPPDRRRWFLSPNNTVEGAVRLNLAGREPAGRIHPADRRRVLTWLSHRLEELVNLDTGGRVVRRCVMTDDVYRRSPGDAFGDLYIEWERSAPIERVWSPAIGTITVPYGHWRQGDHVREGVMFAMGPGIEPGARPGVYDVVNLGATFAAAVGEELEDVDGRPIASVLPVGALATPEPARPVRRRRARTQRALQRAVERGVPDWALRQPPGPNRVHDELAARIGALEATTQRVAQLERDRDVATMQAWLPHAKVPEDVLISVIVPTHNRRRLLEEAIASVEAQSYTRWELLVVDDASTDDTAEYLAMLDDPRIRVLECDGRGCCAARNVALEVAGGDLFVYLDDDNRFDPHWLRAVAVSFAAHPEAVVGYGARMFDDHARMEGKPSSARPWLQFHPWDAEAMRYYNLADTSMLAHRRGEVRFDEELKCYGDWDLLLQLTRESDPLEIPAIAVYYTTHSEDRLTKVTSAEEQDRDYQLILEKLGGS